jgi:hypothetical protein
MKPTKIYETDSEPVLKLGIGRSPRDLKLGLASIAPSPSAPLRAALPVRRPRPSCDGTPTAVDEGGPVILLCHLLLSTGIRYKI